MPGVCHGHVTRLNPVFVEPATLGPEQANCNSLEPKLTVFKPKRATKQSQRGHLPLSASYSSYFCVDIHVSAWVSLTTCVCVRVGLFPFVTAQCNSRLQSLSVCHKQNLQSRYLTNKVFILLASVTNKSSVSACHRQSLQSLKSCHKKSLWCLSQAVFSFLAPVTSETLES